MSYVTSSIIQTALRVCLKEEEGCLRNRTSSLATAVVLFVSGYLCCRFPAYVGDTKQSPVHDITLTL